MLKNDLRQTNYVQTSKAMKKSAATVFSWIFIVLFISISFLLMLIIRGLDRKIENIQNPLASVSDLKTMVLACYPILYIALIAGIIIVYYTLVRFIMQTFCEGKEKNVKLLILKTTKLPGCFCKEALTARQIILSYALPIIIMYIPLLAACIITGDFGVLLSLFFFIILISQDVVMLMYIRRLAHKEKADYISIEEHLYGITLYKKYSYKKIKKGAPVRKLFMIMQAVQ